MKIMYTKIMYIKSLDLYQFFFFFNRNLIDSSIGLEKEKETMSMITTKVNIIASVVLEIKNKKQSFVSIKST